MSKKAGRPRKEISKDQFEKLCMLLCTQEEICGFFGVDHKTLTRWVRREYNDDYSHVYKIYSQDGKISVRRNLMSLSTKSAAAAIFMAKNVLGYTDEGKRQEIDERPQIIIERPETKLEGENED